MAEIRKETGRHDWMRVTLQGPGPGMGKNMVPGILCRNCRLKMYGEDPDRPTVGCVAEVKVANVGRARQHDYLEQEMRLRWDQEGREIQDEIAIGARGEDGQPLTNAERADPVSRAQVRDYLASKLDEIKEFAKG